MYDIIDDAERYGAKKGDKPGERRPQSRRGQVMAMLAEIVSDINIPVGAEVVVWRAAPAADGSNSMASDASWANNQAKPEAYPEVRHVTLRAAWDKTPDDPDKPCVLIARKNKHQKLRMAR